jgi:hypothetical protein
VTSACTYVKETYNYNNIKVSNFILFPSRACSLALSGHFFHHLTQEAIIVKATLHFLPCCHCFSLIKLISFSRVPLQRLVEQAVKKFHTFYGNMKDHCSVHKISRLVLILCHKNRLCTFSPNLFSSLS